MSKVETFELINRKLEEINTKLESSYLRESGYDYLKKYVENNKVITIEDFLEVDIWMALTCIDYIETGNKDIKEAISDIEILKNIYSINDPEFVNIIMGFAFKVEEDNQLDTVIEYLQERSKVKEKLLLKQVYDGDKLHTAGVKAMKNELQDYEIDIVPFLNILRDRKKSDIMTNIFSFLEVHDMMLEDREYNETKVKELDFKLRNKEKDKIFNKILKETYKTELILSYFRRIQEYYNNLKKEEKRFSASLQNEKRILEQLHATLTEKLEKEEITTAREIVKPVKDNAIKLSVLELIKEHNDVYHKKLELRLEELNSDTKSKYLLALSDYNIMLDKKDVSNIMHNSAKDVSNILEILTKFDLDNKLIIKILSNTNLEIIELIKTYIDKGYITIAGLKDNYDMLYLESKKMKKYNESLEFLNNYGINPAIFSNSLDLLFTKVDILKLNIERLNSYGLLNSLRTTNNHYFLGDKDLVEKIDKIIELGYFSYLEEELDILNSPNIKRLELLHYMNMEIDSKEEFLSVLNTDKFFVSDDTMEEYIPNVNKYYSKLELKDLSSIEEYNNRIVYDFDGILISVNKVKRLLDEGKSLYDAIIHNTNFSIDEYERLKGVLKKHVYEKV